MVKRKSVPLMVLAVIAALAMVMPIKAFAAAQEIDIRYYDSAGSIQSVTWNVADSAEVRLSDSSYMSWNATEKTLHLSDMKLAGVSGAYAIDSSFSSSINIELDGKNSISGTSGYGIIALHTINITGPGSLDIKSHENGYAIRTLGLLSVSNGATITADCEISSNSYMDISDSTVTTTSRLICFAALNINGNSDVSAYGLIVDNALFLYPDAGKLLEVKTGTSEADAAHVSGSPFNVPTNCGRLTGVSYFHVKEHNHSYKGYETNNTEHWKKCTDCGALTAAEAHTPTTINTKDATCTEAGYTGDTVCSVCGYEIAKGSATAALGHDYATAWSSDADAHWHACSRCGAAGEKAAHSFAWVVDKAATATASGSKHEQCSVCGYAKAAVELPATGSSNTGASSGGSSLSGGSSSTAKLPATGDPTAPLATAALALASAALAATAFAIHTRKKAA